MRWGIAASLVASVVVMLGCSNETPCAAACPEIVSPILHVNGYVIIAATSTCQNVNAVTPSDLSAAAVGPAGGTCTFDVALDDGEKLAINVPFTTDAQECCCGSCSTVKAATFTPMTISAPPGYVHDAGTD